jgi:hypothetical protein
VTPQAVTSVTKLPDQQVINAEEMKTWHLVSISPNKMKLENTLNDTVIYKIT